MCYFLLTDSDVCGVIAESERMVLDWPKRMKIAIGASRGLAYLHEGCKCIFCL